MDESIEEWVQKLKERAEKRQEKLYPKVIQGPSSDTTCSEQDVSYPPLSPLPEESYTSSMAETDKQDESSIMTEYKHGENTSPSQLDYSSDLSLECDTDTNTTTTTTTTTNDFYRAEPAVCHSSPDYRAQLGTGSRQASPRKPIHPSTYQYGSLQLPNPSATSTTTPLKRLEIPPVVTNPLQERQVGTSQKVLTYAQPAFSNFRSTSSEQLMSDLAKKIDRTETSAKQLSKAVTYSKIGSREHIEAARLLKIAQVGVHHLRLVKHKLDKGIGDKAESLGSLRLYNIGLEIRSALKEDLALDGVFHYFFCTASCGPEVKATATIDTDSIRAQNQKDYILFEEQMTFSDLPPDFTVEIQIYEYVKKPMKFVERTLEALSTPKKSRPTYESEFNRVGFIKLTKDDRKNDEPKTLKFENGSKYINSRFRFQMELRPEQMPTKSGMLHVRCLDDDGRPDWLRSWVDLSNGRIRFWKSKQDCQDKHAPEQTIELKDICCDEVQKLTPGDDLYRQNSFVLYERALRRDGEGDTLFQRILDDGKRKIIRHQLAVNSKEERDSWCSLLDKSMHIFREWNGKNDVYGIEEFKELFST